MKADNNKPFTAILLKRNSEYLFFLREFSNCKIAKHKESQRARFPIKGIIILVYNTTRS